MEEDKINILENGMIQHIFEFSKSGNGDMTFRDALVMPQEAYDALTPEQITAMKQARFDNWLAVINAPPTEAVLEEVLPVLPTPEPQTS